ncbi:hypothetical protein DRA31_01170 [Salmonella enterica subsp. enterica]|nr:hypothetical protein [Salmonella enterica subsp. enterica]
MLVQSKEKGLRGKGVLRVTAPDRKGPKGLKGRNWRRSTFIREDLAQLNGFRVGANKKADPLRSAFRRSLMNGSSHLNLSVIPIWRNKLLLTGVEIV